MFTLKTEKGTVQIGKEMEMVTERKRATGGEPIKKLRLKKETLRDLDPKKRGSEVKGGSNMITCPTNPNRPR